MNSSFYIANRAKLRQKASSPLIVVSGNGQIQKSLDQPFPFYQDNNFRYLTGVNEPDYILVIGPSEEFLIEPAFNKIKAIFDGQADKLELSRLSGVNQILSNREGWQRLRQLINQANSVASVVPTPGLIRRLSLQPNPARRLLINRLKAINRKLKFEDINRVLAQARMVKQPVEIEAIEKAIDITDDSLKEALDPKKLKTYSYTYQVEAAITHGFRNRGASPSAFEPIVAQGERATTIHYVKNDQKLNGKELLLVDVGCEVDGYCSDISRTVGIGQPSPRQKEVYEAVYRVQERAIGMVRKGMLMKDFELKVEKLIGKELIGLGLIGKVDRASIKKYYPHSVSHSLGLDVHDLADYSQPLPTSSVITIEPGIYIAKEGIGVRLEDDVLVTDSGCRVLSKSIPKSLSFN